MCEIQSMQSQDIGELAGALAAAQAELPAAIKGSVNPHLRNKYADINSVYTAIREVLPKHGLAVIQTMLPTDGSKAHVRTMLAHKSGQWIAGECVMPLDRQGGAQGMGSAITYARRYSLSAIVGVVTEEDDDGNAAQGRTSKAQAQAQREQAKAANPEPMTDAQSKALMAYFSKKYTEGSNDDKRNAYLSELSNFFERKISSSRELTKTMVSQFLDVVMNQPQEAY